MNGREEMNTNCILYFCSFYWKKVFDIETDLLTLTDRYAIM